MSCSSSASLPSSFSYFVMISCFVLTNCPPDLLSFIQAVRRLMASLRSWRKSLLELRMCSLFLMMVEAQLRLFVCLVGLCCHEIDFHVTFIYQDICMCSICYDGQRSPLCIRWTCCGRHKIKMFEIVRWKYFRGPFCSEIAWASLTYWSFRSKAGMVECLPLLQINFIYSCQFQAY
jgi:hypothetical protein